MNITRVGFKAAVFVFNSMESSMSLDKGAMFVETDKGILISDNHPERARKRSLFSDTLVPWGNIAYVACAKEAAPVVEKRSKRTVKEEVASE